MAASASGVPPPAPTLSPTLKVFNYTKLVTQIISLKAVIDKVELDYNDIKGTQKKANELASFSSSIRLDIVNIDLDEKIINPMKTIYEEYTRKVTLIKRLQSLANGFAGPRPLVQGDIDDAIARLDDVSAGPQYNATTDDDQNLDGITDGRATMLNIYRLYIYGYLFLYEIHRLYIYFGVYIKDVYLPLIGDVLRYIRENRMLLEDVENQLRDLEQQLEAARREAAELEEEIERLRRDSAGATRPEDIDALNRAIQEKRAELERVRRVLAATTGSSARYRVRTDELQQYLRTLSGITIDNLKENVNQNIINSLQPIQLGGSSAELRDFIRDAGTRIQSKVQTDLIAPAQRFFNECVAEFTQRIMEYNSFKDRIARFYDQLQRHLATINQINEARRNINALDLDGKRTERSTLREAAQRAIERQRLEQERDDLDAQIRRTQNEMTNAPATQAALETKMRDLKTRFERLEAELVHTDLRPSIDNAKAQVNLIGVPALAPPTSGGRRRRRPMRNTDMAN